MSEILRVENLKMYFPLETTLFGKVTKSVKSVDDISFSIEKGTTFGLLGESGCGKTTAGKCILRLLTPTDGKIVFDGTDITKLSNQKMAPHRRDIQMIFQDPYGSLDPRQTVGSIVREAIKADGKPHTKEQLNARTDELLTMVELSPAFAGRYPHELSGGQRQRLGIARAIACEPKLIVCDEPVSALDVSIQAQIINLFIKLQKELGLTYLFIAHDIAVVRHIADKIAIMYLGHLVETVDAAELYQNPLHPYTKALLSAVPTTDYYAEQQKQRILLEGEVPSPINVPGGCPFHPRCKYCMERCKTETPQLRDNGNGHMVACHMFGGEQK